MEDVTPSEAQPTSAAREQTEPPRGRRLGPTSLLAIAIAVVVVVATAIVLVAGDQPVPSYPAGTPEEALQRYLIAWYDEDFEVAYGVFSTRIQAQMSYDEFRATARDYYRSDNGQEVRIDRVSGDGDRRTVYLSVEEFYGSDFGSSSYTSEYTVAMLLEAGGWRVDDALVGLNEYYDY